MATSKTSLPPGLPASRVLDQKEGANPADDLGAFNFLHEVFRCRAADKVQTPLMAFPKSERGPADFEYFNGQDLDRFTDRAAWHYTRQNLRTTEKKVVALVGPTSLDWVASVYGLSRAGYAILTLSPRLSCQAIVKLMKETEAKALIYHESLQLISVVEEVKAVMPVQTLPLLPRSKYDQPGSPQLPFLQEVSDLATDVKKQAIILHSSGSSGLPKSVSVTHARFTMHYGHGSEQRDFLTLPLYHSFGMSFTPGRMYHRNTVYFPNHNLPLTYENLMDAIKEARPDLLYVVPYALKLLAEQKAGIEALKSSKQVMFIGSQCPDDLGDHLVENGVQLASFIGSTECGFIGTSLGRPPGDNAWNYIRPAPPMMKNIWPKPLGDGTCEFIYLKDYPGRVASNSNDPPESFHSSDIFVEHQTIKGAWKYLGRLDDRVTLLNGEKVLPLPIEGRVRQEAQVKEAIVFGIGRAIPGLLLFRAESAQSLSDKEFVDSVWPTLEAANHNAEGFSQIGRDMVVPMSVDIQIPSTDKGTFIRAQVYMKFEKEIENAYQRLEEQQEGNMKLDLPEMERYLTKLAQGLLGVERFDRHTDLFILGMNSLQAIQMRGFILRDLDLSGNGKRLGQNAVFEKGNIAALAKHLHDLRHSQETVGEKPITIMRELIKKYSNFEKRVSSDEGMPSGHVIVLTGATGGLGAHILAQILGRQEVEKVYCLVRGDKPLLRLEKSLQDRGLRIADPSKLSALTCDISEANLGLDTSTYGALLAETTGIIHCAWPVNFQLGLQSFEPHIRGLQNLLQLSLNVQTPTSARFLFCSSISAALGTPPPAIIAEAPIPELEHASHTGYAQSKLVGERIVEHAVQVAGADAVILRIGQVVGDTKAGVWNDNEAFPLIVRSALTMGVLPQLNMACEWLPVDTLAASIIEIAGLDKPSTTLTNGTDHANMPNGYAEQTNGVLTNGDTHKSRLQPQLVYNLRSPHTFSWTSDYLPALSKAGLSFSSVPFKTWIDKLRSLASARADSKRTAQPAADPNKNPAIKLVDFFDSDFAGEEGEKDRRVILDISEAEKASTALKDTPDVIQSGLAGKMLKVWLAKWNDEAVRDEE